MCRRTNFLGENLRSLRASGLKFEQLEARAMFAAGDLDTSFGQQGFAINTLDAGYGFVRVQQLAKEPDAKILELVVAYDGKVHRSLLARFNADGSPDNSFGSSGELWVTQTDFVTQMIVDAQGRILLSGNDGARATLWRLNPDGSADPTFGQGGAAELVLPDGRSIGQTAEIAIDSQGRILATSVGPAHPDGGSVELYVVRLDESGALDTSYGNAGLARQPSAVMGDVTKVAVDLQGRLVVLGFGTLGKNWTVARFTSDGLPDTSFNKTGVVQTFLGSVNDAAYDLAFLPDGKLLVVGTDNIGSGGIDVVRYNDDGSLDPSFGTGGLIDVAFNLKSDPLEIGIDSHGKIVLGGPSELERFFTDGTQDNSFGSYSRVTPPFGSGFSFGGTLIIDAQNRMVQPAILQNGQFGLVRYLGDPVVPSVPSLTVAGATVTNSPDGVVPLTFAVTLSAPSSNTVQVNYQTADDTAQAGTDYIAESGILVFSPGVTQQTVTVLVSRNVVPEPNKSFVLNLSGNVGAPLLTNQATGQIISDLPGLPHPGDADESLGFLGSTPWGPHLDQSTQDDTALQSDGKIIQGARVRDPSTGLSSFALTRFNKDGSLDTTFGTAGLAQFAAPTSGTATVSQILIDFFDRIYIVGGNGQNVEVVRFDPDGHLDTTFGSGGFVSPALPRQVAPALAVRGAFDLAGRLVLAVATQDQSSQPTALLARLLPDSTLDTGFGSGGVLLPVAPGAYLGKDFELSSISSLVIGFGDEIVVAGNAVNESFNAVLRFNDSGALDTTFGSQGLLLTNEPGFGFSAPILSQQRDGKLLIALRYSTADSSEGLQITRYLADGTLDTSFGTAGSVQFVSPVPIQNFTIRTDIQGKVLALLGGTEQSVTVVRYLPGGTLDASFGVDGVSLDGDGVVPRMKGTPGLLLDAQGRIVIGIPGDFFRVIRLLGDATDVPVISAAPVWQLEGNQGITDFVFHVRLSQPSKQLSEVYYAKVPLTPIPPPDFQFKSGTLTFVPGQTTASVTIPVQGDLFVEPNETFAFILGGTTTGNVVVDRSTAYGTIVNDDTPTWQNPITATDTNSDGNVTPLDALVVINQLNAQGTGELGVPPTGRHFFYDVNGDGAVTPLDALMVINQLNGVPAAGSVTASLTTREQQATEAALAGSGGNAPAVGMSSTAPTNEQIGPVSLTASRPVPNGLANLPAAAHRQLFASSERARWRVDSAADELSATLGIR